MYLWIDDTKQAPYGHIWCKSVNEAKQKIQEYEELYEQVLDEYDFPSISLWKSTPIKIIDIGYDAGEYRSEGGDYIMLLRWLEKTGRDYPIRIHTTNKKGIAKMRKIIRKNGWNEIPCQETKHSEGDL